MGQSVPHVQFFAAFLEVTITLGNAATSDGASVFMVGADVGMLELGYEGLDSPFWFQAGSLKLTFH